MYDENFNKLIDFIFGVEKGYVNDKNDSGGPTNLGVTYEIYDAWNREHGKPLKDIKQITRAEAKEIYYNWYWLESGANKLEDLREAYVLFDMAINSSPYEAKRIFKESNNNIYKFLENRKKYYDRIIELHPEKQGYRQGWYNRLRDVEDNINKIVEEGLYTPPYDNEITPFDEEYEGIIKIGDKKDGSKYTPEELKRARNKYLYMQYKKGEYNKNDSDKAQYTSPINKNDKFFSHNNLSNFNSTSNQLDRETEEQHKAMTEGFDSGIIADEDHGIKRLNHLLSEYNRDWKRTAAEGRRAKEASLSTKDPLNARSKKKQFNVGDPNTDKGHWVTIKGNHVFIEDV